MVERSHLRHCSLIREEHVLLKPHLEATASLRAAAARIQRNILLSLSVLLEGHGRILYDQPLFVLEHAVVSRDDRRAESVLDLGLGFIVVFLVNVED